MNIYTKIIAVAVSTMFMVTLLPAVYAIPEDTQANDVQDEQIIAEEEVDYSKVVFTNRPTIIFSDEENCNYIAELKDSTSKISISEKLDNCTSNQIAILDGKWAAKQNKDALINQTSDLISHGTPVITVADSPELLINSNKDGFSSYATEAQIFGIYTNPVTGSQYCLSIVSEDIDDALLRAYNWADNMILNNTASSNSYGPDTTNLQWGQEYGSLILIPSDIYGNGRILTKYFPLTENVGSTADYYYVHYQFQSKTPSVTSRYFSGIDTMKIISRVGNNSTNGQYQSIEDYGPKTTIGSTNYHVGLSLSVGTGGAAISGNVSWNRDFPTPVVVYDYTNTALKTMELDFNLDKKNGNYILEPGLIVRCDRSSGGNGDYHATDYYSVTYWTLDTTNPMHAIQQSYTLDKTVETVVPSPHVS